MIRLTKRCTGQQFRCAPLPPVSLVVIPQSMNPICDNLNALPEVLYQYRDCSDHAIRSASNGEFHFSSAKDFNDPHECRFVPISFMLELQGEKLAQRMKRRISEIYPDSSKQERESLFKRGMEQARKAQAGDEAAYEALFDTQYSAYGISCFSARNDLIPMWGYYGDKHKGICIGVRTEAVALAQLEMAQEGKLLSLHVVDYVESLPTVHIDDAEKNISDASLDESERPFYTKSRHWAHEEEIRLTWWKAIHALLVLGPHAVSEVILGSRIPNQNRAQLVGSLKNAGSTAKLFQAVPSFGSYDISIVPLKDVE